MKLLFLIAFLFLQIDAQTMTDKLRRRVLNAHNNFRSKVAKGLAVNKNGTTLPKAGNMNMLTYSKKIEAYAKKLAGTCYFDMYYEDNTSNNLWARARSKSYVPQGDALSNAVDSWYSELATDGLDTLAMNNNPQFTHFTQLAWDEATEIGCAVKNCPGIDILEINNYHSLVINGAKVGERFKWTFVVCNYFPTGNIQKEYLYKASNQTGSDCPVGTSANSLGLCHDPDGTKTIH